MSSHSDNPLELSLVVLVYAGRGATMEVLLRRPLSGYEMQLSRVENFLAKNLFSAPQQARVATLLPALLPLPLRFQKHFSTYILI